MSVIHSDEISTTMVRDLSFINPKAKRNSGSFFSKILDVILHLSNKILICLSFGYAGINKPSKLHTARFMFAKEKLVLFS